ncbi:MAG: paaF [Cyanobacteria bacterium RYN_339]|nr:paaF [Cyanobacteria bacterium RYN_339]
MTTATQQFVKLRIDERVAVITIDHPPVNALNSATMAELGGLFDQVEADDNVKAIVLTGNGMAFVAGADINEIIEITDAENAKALVLKGQALFTKIERGRKPVICAINGVALGGGLELAMACHIRICSDRAKLGLPEISLGIIPGFGGTVRLPRLVGPSKATQMMLTDDKITAQEAYRVGLVNKVVPESDVMKEALGMAKKISSFGAKAIGAIMESLDYGRSHTIDEALAKEADLFGAVSQTADMREGTTAFKEKRRPTFTDK